LLSESEATGVKKYELTKEKAKLAVDLIPGQKATKIIPTN